MLEHVMTQHEDHRAASKTTVSRDEELDHIKAAIGSIRFGEVRVIIQDGVVVQIERIEKERLRR
ncbi:YezD family protein [Singulisphaera sp. Ch08]|uniref:YezD family protein n=1 Tax=Singulisphaera sp. Ch08 TaxID=3120278 RepID=A0AAU7CLT6_9BACT